MDPNKEMEFVAALSARGEPAVRTALEEGQWGDGTDHRRLARKWLHELEEARTKLRDDNAQRSVAAAERAATASEKSARFAMLSAFIALATVAVTVLTGGFLAWLFSL